MQHEERRIEKKKAATIITSFHQELLTNTDLLCHRSATNYNHTLGGANRAAVLTGLLLLSNSPLDIGDTIASVGLIYLQARGPCESMVHIFRCKLATSG